VRGLKWLKRLLLLAAAAFLALLLYGYGRSHPEDMPWADLDLTRPVGAFTGRKLTALGGEGERCRALLREAGVRFTPLPSRQSGQCGYDDALWEWHVVQPAALEHLGSKVASVDHFGSYSCRRIYGRSEGAWSEHATANAVDIAGFRLADGRRISVAGDWKDEDPEARFLRAVRDGACDLFATVLSPDYNAAHRDHLHFDQAQRGAMGWRGCR
jgi:hypothetical protein